MNARDEIGSVPEHVPPYSLSFHSMNGPAKVTRRTAAGLLMTLLGIELAFVIAYVLTQAHLVIRGVDAAVRSRR